MRLPSPPMTTSPSIRGARRLRAAASCPSRVRKAALRAVPIIVPPSVQDAAQVGPAQAPDAVAAVDHPLIALVDGVDGDALGQRRTGHRAQGGVHALRVAAAGEDADCE